jgi:uncharacterized protein YjbI with pentapeptide repeats
MHVIKPQVLGLTSRPIEYRKRMGLSVSAFLYVPFAQAAHGTLWTEQSMWNFLGGEMKPVLIDEGIKKLTSEFLVYGYAYPRERPNAVAVRARLGTREKTLLVFGDRYWKGIRATEPIPFERMPLTWDRAYGGEGYAPNPAGRGRAVIDGRRWLPNIELPGSRLLAPDDVVTPAGFGMLDVTHPQRARYRGTYDQAWMKEHAPGFAPDLDWSYFNLASSDQWLNGPLKGDESFALDNMHPQRPLIEGALPRLAVRIFIKRKTRDGGTGDLTLAEVAMSPTTVWFFPHAERLVLIFHGLAKVGEDDGSDVVQLIGGVERPGEPKDVSHYANVIAKRQDIKRAAVEALNDGDLVPAGLDTADPESERMQAVMRSEGLREEAAYRRAQIDVGMARDQLRAQGKDPDALGVRLPPREKPTSSADWPAYLERVQRETDAQQWAAVEDAVTHLERVLAFAQQTGRNPADLVPHGPPRFQARVELDEIAKGFARAGARFDRTAIEDKLKQQELMLHHDYLRNAHMQAPAVPLQGEQAAEARREIEWLLSRGLRTLPGIDLTGVDLSKLDLRGVDFSGAWLESANLSEANLTGANLTAAVLAHANLSRATATGANFQSANLGRAQLAGSVFDQANLRSATLRFCKFGGTRFHGTNVNAADLLDTAWGAADWSGVSGEGVLFYKLDLKGMVLRDSNLSSCNFIECDLTGVDFRGAALSSVSFVTCKADGAHFAGATLPGASFVERTSLAGADFAHANLAGANLAECMLDGARLVRATLEGANFGRASLVGCDARFANAKGALLRRTVLARARLTGANFKDAILQHADLRGADLRQANLFGADLSRVRLDGDVRLDGALLERARTYPRLTPAEHAAGE